jgi:hypothetical protein
MARVTIWRVFSGEADVCQGSQRASARRQILKLQSMKKMIQFVAWLMAALVLGQPALAATFCAQGLMGDDGCAPVCCVEASNAATLQVSGSCHSAVNSPAATSGCGQNACAVPATQVIAQLTLPSKPKMDRMAQPTLVPPIRVPLSREFTATRPSDVVAASPARYLLLQIFRI